jgi:hypothetical protein
MRDPREAGAGARPRIGTRVREVHLSHFCPGGAGFPVTSPSSAGVDLETRFSKQPGPAGPGHSPRADGEACGRCGQPLTADEDVRRSASGRWLHESCPAAPPRGQAWLSGDGRCMSGTPPKTGLGGGPPA